MQKWNKKKWAGKSRVRFLHLFLSLFLYSVATYILVRNLKHHCLALCAPPALILYVNVSPQVAFMDVWYVSK